jgi:predicted RNA-binding Zn ribbon-like protein
MPRKPPRYDLPHAAPEPLRLVQRFVNTCDLSHDRDWLADWLPERGVHSPSALDLRRARRLREAIRELLYANNGQASTRESWVALREAADSAGLTIDFAPPRLVSRADGLERLLGEVVIAAYTAIGEGTWPRLKCCRNHECRWAFYDYSRNRSASWCSMQICGNRTKTSAYRRRLRQRSDS